MAITQKTSDADYQCCHPIVGKSRISSVDYIIGLAVFLTLNLQVSANVVGPDGQNFNPVHGGGRFFTVEPSAVLGKGVLNFSLFGDYAQNALPYYKTGDTDSETAGFKDSLVGANISMGIGVMKNLSLGLHTPLILSQKVKTDDARVDFKTAGLMEFRLDIKYKVWSNKKHGIATVLSFSQNQIQNNPFSGTGSGITAILQLVYDWAMTDRFTMGLNAGFKKKQPGEKDVNFPIEPQESQILASVGMSYLFPSASTNLILEYFMSQPQESKDSVVDRQNSSSEILLGAKISATKSIEIGIGAGKEGANGMFSPDLRYFLGLTYMVGPLWGVEEKPKKVAEKKKKKREEAPAEPEVPATPEILEDSKIASAGDGSTDTFQTSDIQFASASERKAYSGAQQYLNALGEHMKTRGFTSLKITGHTDNQGSNAANLKLGLGRARTIKEYLVNNFGHDPAKITIASRGEEEPIADNKTEQGRKLNRRAVFVLEY